MDEIVNIIKGAWENKVNGNAFWKAFAKGYLDQKIFDDKYVAEISLYPHIIENLITTLGDDSKYSDIHLDITFLSTLLLVIIGIFLFYTKNSFLKIMMIESFHAIQES